MATSTFHVWQKPTCNFVGNSTRTCRQAQTTVDLQVTCTRDVWLKLKLLASEADVAMPSRQPARDIRQREPTYLPGALPASSSGQEQEHHYEVRWSSGELIDMLRFETRILDHTNMLWEMYRILHHVQWWPPEYLTFAVGDRQFQYVHPMMGTIPRDDKVNTLLTELREDCLSKGFMSTAEDAKLPIIVIRHPPPDMFWKQEDGGDMAWFDCICKFPGQGCCVTGRTDHVQWRCDESTRWGLKYHRRCWWCGNRDECTRGLCHHPCCREKADQGVMEANWICHPCDEP